MRYIVPMSRVDGLLRSLGQSAELRRLGIQSPMGDAASSEDAEDTYTYSYLGVVGRRHWVRRSDGRRFSGDLATNGAIAIGSRVRFANRQIDAMPYQPLPPRPDPQRATPQFLGEVLVIFIAPDSAP